MLTGCGAIGTDQPAAQQPKPSITHKVGYVLQSAHQPESISYTDENGEQQELRDASATLPFLTTFEVDAAKVSYLSARTTLKPLPALTATGAPKATCRLFVDDKLVDEKTGDYAVTCSTSLPPKA
ncbi:hypothetical protein BG844_16940 [Couchioplanes caeruleus subsp. caeruleus]|uniref:Uncharacterized protein n=2 Tax=Couchioplanes caeruleus TaxID=56438 RepID=A0A1K0G797_9ACTN|nr:hypothetical protein BG844_16940 [Couchioplanes caeruleus subsp. caeruleus]